MNAIQQVITYTLFLPALFGCGVDEMKTVSLDTYSEIPNANYIIQRSPTGRWEAMDEGFTAGGTNPSVYAIAVRQDGLIVAGGRNLIEASGVTVNNIAMWNGTAWSALGNGLNDSVLGLGFLPNGDLILCGYFTDVNGGPGGTYNRVAGYNFDTGYYALGAGLNGWVQDVAIDQNGHAYFVGQFTDVQGGPGGTYNRIVCWNGASYIALGTGLNNTGYRVIIGPNNQPYVTGSFTTADGVTVNYVARWTGTTFAALGSGIADGPAGGIASAPNGIIYVAAYSTLFGGVAANYIASWNGSSWAPLGDGLDFAMAELCVDPSTGLLYAGGPYAGSEVTTTRLSIWDGSMWSRPDVTLPGTAVVSVIRAGQERLFLGYDTAGTAITSGFGAVEINNAGSADTFPKFIVKRSGGTLARLESIRNLTAGNKLLFDWPLLDGEQIEIDLTPGKKMITSSFSGNALNRLLANSDIGAFRLVPGVNEIGVYVVQTGAPTMTGFIQWPEQYLGLDG